MTDLNTKLILQAHAAIFERPRLDRRQLLNSMQRLDYEMRLRHYPAVFESPAADEQEYEAEQMRRESVADRVCAPNAVDTCGCGAEATRIDFRNGHEYGLCDRCY